MGSEMTKKRADATAEGIAGYFVGFLVEKFPRRRHVRRVASWVGFIVLGIKKLTVNYRILHTRQLRFDYAGRSFKAKFNHEAGPRGGIDIVEIVPGKRSPEGAIICSITNLEEAANFYDAPEPYFETLLAD